MCQRYIDPPVLLLGWGLEYGQVHEVCWGLCLGLEEEDQGVIRHRPPLGWTSLLYSQRRYKDMKTADIHVKYISVSEVYTYKFSQDSSVVHRKNYRGLYEHCPADPLTSSLSPHRSVYLFFPLVSSNKKCQISVRQSLNKPNMMWHSPKNNQFRNIHFIFPTLYDWLEGIEKSKAIFHFIFFHHVQNWLSKYIIQEASFLCSFFFTYLI